MLERREDLKDLQVEILDKFYFALESIPLPVLKQFPKFDADSYKKLQDLHRHVKAKLRLVQTKLLRLQKEDEKDVFESTEASMSLSFKSSGVSPTTTSASENQLLNMDDLNTLNASVSESIEFHQESTNIMELDTTNNSNVESTATIKPLEIAVTSKKSTFQLKRPIKTVLNTEVSKTIEEMWEKDQKRSNVINSSVDSECCSKPVKDIFNSNIKTPESNKESTSIGNITIKDSPNSWINVDKSHSKTYTIFCILFNYISCNY